MTQPLFQLATDALAIIGGGCIGTVLWHWLTGPRDRNINPPAHTSEKYK